MTARISTAALISLLVITGLATAAPPAPAQMPPASAVLTLRDQAAVYDGWLRQRLETVLPELMRAEGFDMWVVICRENAEDPVFSSLVPFTAHYASRTTMLVFFDRGAAGVERLTVGRSGIGGLYTSVWEPEKIDQWTRLGEIVAERRPRRIGINESETFNYGDGISATMKRKLLGALPADYKTRVASAERLAVRWLERRTPAEIEVYHHIVAIAHDIIAVAFSNAVITPGVTTTDDVVWWLRERSRQLGLTNWFHPSVDVQRPKDSPHGSTQVIHRGDLLHCDFGIVHVSLCTDTQQMAYVLREGEQDAPAGLHAAFAQGNRLQDIHIEEMKPGRTGNQILAAALTRAKAEGLRPSIYTHPIGIHGHAAGTLVGMWDMQAGVPGTGDFPLFAATAHSIELNVRADVPEWGGQEVRIPLEQDAIVSGDGARWLDRRQTRLFLVR